MERKLILIADPDRDVLKALGNAFHDQGYDVRAARDGSRALEKAILVHPDLVLFDDDCPLIQPKRFVKILRSNPRTEHIPVLIMSGSDVEDPALLGYREALIRKPFNNDEVLAQVATIFRRMVTAQQVREEGREIEGRLAQISLVDLLQIFSLNRKTGLLELKGEDWDGRLFVHEGSLVHASADRHRGEKALFRMLQQRSGSFAFFPEQVTADINVRRSTDMLLLEGARQADELAQLLEQLPSSSVRLVVTAGIKEKFEGLHPVTQEIFNLLEFYNTVEDLVDHARVSDFEACRAIRTLLDKGVLQAVERVEQQQDEEPLLAHEALYELKVRLAGRMFSQSRITLGKICVLCTDENYTREFVGGLRRMPEFDMHGQLESIARGFGRLGRIELSENLFIDLLLLPLDDYLWPLCRPLATASSAFICLRRDASDPRGYDLDLALRQLRGEEELPVVQACLLGDREAGLSAIDPGDAVGFRAGLVALLEWMATGTRAGD